MKNKEETPIKNINQNRKAFFNYHILDTYESGICLKGTEIKSRRANGCYLNEAFVQIENGRGISASDGDPGLFVWKHPEP
jgi:SsrA-binding protein